MFTSTRQSCSLHVSHQAFKHQLLQRRRNLYRGAGIESRFASLQLNYSQKGYSTMVISMYLINGFCLTEHQLQLHSIHP